MKNSGYLCKRVLLPEPFSPTDAGKSHRGDVEADLVERPEILVALQTIEDSNSLRRSPGAS